MKSFKIVVIGGGTGGIFTAARLARLNPPHHVAIIEPSSSHYYQAFWTLIGGGIGKKESTRRPMQSLIPNGVTWIKNRCSEIIPSKNKIILDTGEEVAFEFLVVSPGLRMDWEKISGLKDNMGRFGICSNFTYETVDFTWKALREFKGGTAVFTVPNTPIKCPGAAQKIMWLAEDWFTRQGIRNKSKVVFLSSGQAIFGIPKYRAALEKLVADRGIETIFKHNLTKVDAEKKILTAQDLDTGKTMEMNFDMIHITPPMSPPDFIKKGPLANAEGFVDVNQYTLQHKSFSNIFALGDSAGLPTARTGAAIRKESPVLVSNLMDFSKGISLSKNYNGYSSCPLITRKGRVIMAEFGYDDKVMETFPFDQSKESWAMWVLKKDILPFLYWNLMVKGLM